MTGITTMTNNQLANVDADFLKTVSEIMAPPKKVEPAQPQTLVEDKKPDEPVQIEEKKEEPKSDEDKAKEEKELEEAKLAMKPPVEPAPTDAARTLSGIADEIRADWKKVNFAAVPYLDAMSSLKSIEDNYYDDSGRSVVAYFLSNASSWKGDKAKAIKKELNGMLKEGDELVEAVYTINKAQKDFTADVAKDEVGYITNFEEGSLDTVDVVRLFAWLIRSGRINHLQGSYQRTASQLMDAGVIGKAGIVDFEKLDDLAEAMIVQREDSLLERVIEDRKMMGLSETPIPDGVLAHRMAKLKQKREADKEKAEAEARGAQMRKKEDVHEGQDNLEQDVSLQEVSPPDEKLKTWLEDPKVQESFKKQYGEDYKKVMFAKAWKMHKEHLEPSDELTEKLIQEGV